MKKDKTKPLLEITRDAWAESQFDRQSLVLSNLCLLGSVSRNGRKYPESVLQESLQLFQGCKAYLNHPTTTGAGGERCRDVRDLVGRFSTPRLVEGKLKADLEVLPQHADLIFALASQMPDLVGMSINARGRTCSRDGEEIVESITQVKSVDLVTEPAATRSLFESLEFSYEQEVMNVNWEEVTLELLTEQRPDLIEAIEKPLKEQIEEHRIKEQLVERRDHVQKAIREANLPSTAITEAFTQSLLEAQDDQRLQALIEDRVQLVGSLSGKPESREKTLSGGNGRPTDEEMYGTRG